MRRNLTAVYMGVLRLLVRTPKTGQRQTLAMLTQLKAAYQLVFGRTGTRTKVRQSAFSRSKHCHSASLLRNTDHSVQFFTAVTLAILYKVKQGLLLWTSWPSFRLSVRPSIQTHARILMKCRVGSSYKTLLRMTEFCKIRLSESHAFFTGVTGLPYFLVKVIQVLSEIRQRKTAHNGVDSLRFG